MTDWKLRKKWKKINLETLETAPQRTLVLLLSFRARQPTSSSAVNHKRSILT